MPKDIAFMLLIRIRIVFTEEKNIWENNGWKLPIFDKRHKPTKSRSSANSKEVNPKKLLSSSNRTVENLKQIIKNNKYTQNTFSSKVNDKWYYIHEKVRVQITVNVLFKQTNDNQGGQQKVANDSLLSSEIKEVLTQKSMSDENIL